MPHTPRSVLVTGGAGFIGSNFLLAQVPAHPDARFVNLDLLTYAGSLLNLRAIEDAPNYASVHGDVADADLVRRLFAEHAFDTVVHFAAESHVGRSILDPIAFVRTNVLGTATLLEAARQAWRGPGSMRGDVRFHHVSTDEVFGALGDDWGYAMDPAKIEGTLNWTPAHTFESGLRDTVRWYFDHPDWLDTVAPTTNDE